MASQTQLDILDKESTAVQDIQMRVPPLEDITVESAYFRLFRGGTCDIVQTISHLTGPHPSSYASSHGGSCQGGYSISSGITIRDIPKVHFAQA